MLLIFAYTCICTAGHVGTNMCLQAMFVRAFNFFLICLNLPEGVEVWSESVQRAIPLGIKSILFLCKNVDFKWVSPFYTLKHLPSYATYLGFSLTALSQCFFTTGSNEKKNPDKTAFIDRTPNVYKQINIQRRTKEKWNYWPLVVLLIT